MRTFTQEEVNRRLPVGSEHVIRPAPGHRMDQEGLYSCYWPGDIACVEHNTVQPGHRGQCIYVSVINASHGYSEFARADYKIALVELLGAGDALFSGEAVCDSTTPLS